MAKTRSPPVRWGTACYMALPRQIESPVLFHTVRENSFVFRLKSESPQPSFPFPSVYIYALAFCPWPTQSCREPPRWELRVLQGPGSSAADTAQHCTVCGRLPPPVPQMLQCIHRQHCWVMRWVAQGALGRAWAALQFGTILPSIRYKKLETRGTNEMFLSTSIIKTPVMGHWLGRGRESYNSHLPERIKKLKHFNFLEHKRIMMGRWQHSKPGLKIYVLKFYP